MDDNELLAKLKDKAEPLPSGQAIMRVLHTRTEITIYPNGQTYQKSQSWFEGQTYPVKKKEKVKGKAVQKAEIKNTEEY